MFSLLRKSAISCLFLNRIRRGHEIIKQSFLRASQIPRHSLPGPQPVSGRAKIGPWTCNIRDTEVQRG